MAKKVRKRISEELAAQLETYIVDGLIDTGESLPSERKLCEMFQTSRSSVREALKILEQKKIIDIKLGVAGGAFVKPANTESIKENLESLMRRQHISLRHLSEFREGGEGVVISLAAQRATPEDIQSLKDILGELKTCIQEGLSGWDAYIRVDEKFHIKIAKIAANPLYLMMLQVVHEQLTPFYIRNLQNRQSSMEEDYKDAVLIVKSIEQKDSEQAKIIMCQHIRKFNHVLRFKAIAWTKDNLPPI